MQTDIYFVRHGQTAANRGWRINGETEEALTEVGRWQAQCVAQRLVDQGIQALYTSPLLRAWETATIIGDWLNLQPEKVPEIRELNTGEASGLHSLQFLLRYPRLLWAWAHDDVALCFPGGDVLGEFYQRVKNALDMLISRHPNQTIAVVAHGGSISAALSILLFGQGSNRFAWKLRNTGLSLIRIQPGQQPQLLLFNDTSHLMVQKIGPLGT
jgi:broad specificity phosphatase PhoE